MISETKINDVSLLETLYFMVLVLYTFQIMTPKLALLSYLLGKMPDPICLQQEKINRFTEIQVN